MAHTFSDVRRLLLSIVVSSAIVTSAAGCSSSGTPSAAPTSSAGSTQSSVLPSASTPVPVSTLPSVTRPTQVTTTAPPPAASPGTTVTPADTGTAGPGTDLDGEVYGRIVAVDPASSEVTFDKYDWFVGQDAEQACAQDGVTEHDNGWCTVYYYRNRNPMLRVLTVSPDAAVLTLVDGSPADEPGDLSTVQARLTSNESSGLFRINVTDGQVTAIQELYFP